MIISKLLTVTILTTVTLLAGDVRGEVLIKKAKHNGLVAIPSDKAKLMKLIDKKKNITPERVKLGRQLFFDKRLSLDKTINCNSCHLLDQGGDDNLPVAVGYKGRENPHHINSPTVYNSVFFSRQFWDGRSPDVEDQAQGPMVADVEMNISPKEAEKRINAVPEYVQAFKNAYGKDVKINFEKIASTIGIFERTLVTPSRYDDFLNGDLKALTTAEQDGLALFIETGCTACHVGIAIGGKMQPFDLSSAFEHNDVGDFKGDKNGMIKAPTLRNVSQTSPYFHNGTVDNLREAIKTMGQVQLLIDISDDEAKRIETFLKSLEGRKPDTSAPKLP
ncbi:Cytochrome c551 peroxidase [hydrothermal vent metagenome]|uniref:Cytochrome c551 peroxidase n=1 Tax=hydrothermal vent metagenome TaxID=652676 RepID=A0A1W1C1N0_9ZZZZ